ncbi:MAG: hypothetical protein IJT94_11145, partial [Oscillibacter sp.]|nr:hypothetical protein [Oscillibacter sp.]
AFCDSLDKALRITLREVEQREGLSPDAAPEGEPASGGAVEAGMADTAAKVSGTVADSPAEAGREAAGTAEGVSGTPGHSLADNAIHFALLSYAAGVASRRYVALLRKQYARPDSAPPSGKVSRKETREKAARREAKTAKREAKATDKAAKREGKTPEKDAERDSRHTEAN